MKPPQRKNRAQKQLQEANDTSNSPVITQEDDATPGSTPSTLLILQPLLILRPNQNVVGPKEKLLVRHLYIFEINTVTANRAVEDQLAEKDRELEELRRQLQEAQDKARARKHTASQLGLHPLPILLTVDALATFNRQHLSSSLVQITSPSSQSQTTQHSCIQRQPLAPVVFLLNTQDNDASDIEEYENIDASLHTTLAPTQWSNSAATEPMQVGTTITEQPKSGRQAKEPLHQRLGFEKNKRGYDDFRVYHSLSKLTIDVCTTTPDETQSQFQFLFFPATKVHY
jgi:hypothetical protein